MLFVMVTSDAALDHDESPVSAINTREMTYDDGSYALFGVLPHGDKPDPISSQGDR